MRSTGGQRIRKRPLKRSKIHDNFPVIHVAWQRGHPKTGQPCETKKLKYPLNSKSSKGKERIKWKRGLIPISPFMMRN